MNQSIIVAPRRHGLIRIHSKVLTKLARGYNSYFLDEDIDLIIKRISLPQYFVGQEALNWVKVNNNGSDNVALENDRKFFENEREKCSEITETV